MEPSPEKAAAERRGGIRSRQTRNKLLRRSQEKKLRQLQLR
uniref:Uncharacterized protein n=1 Tax=Arundo donax TaxID=35708 RepID=A0A0A8YIZ0_ARUDO